MSRAVATTRDTKSPVRAGVKRVRTKKRRRSSKAADPLAAKSDLWVTQLLKQADDLAADYHEDFLKSRQKDPLRAGVRARIRTKLNSYAKRCDELSTAFANPPNELLPQLDRSRATARGKQISATFSQVIVLIKVIHSAIESARSRLAAPLSGEEERSFWLSIEQIGIALQSLQDFIDDLYELIAAEQRATTEADPEFAKDPDKLWDTLLTLQDAIETFSRKIGTASTTPVSVVPAYLDAVSHYQSTVERVQRNIREMFPVLPEPVRRARARTSDEPLATGVHKLRSMLDSHLHFLCTALAAREACMTNLPKEADEAAQKIRDAISEISIATARIDMTGGDVLARCDTLPESELTDYRRLAGLPKEGGQLQAIVDSLLNLYVEQGPEQTMTVKKIAARAALLGGNRRVKGLGQGTVRVKLKKLVEEMGLVRKIPAKKSKKNQNAADGYRLSHPAAKKYMHVAADVQAEFVDIESLGPATDPLD